MRFALPEDAVRLTELIVFPFRKKLFCGDLSRLWPPVSVRSLPRQWAGSLFPEIFLPKAFLPASVIILLPEALRMRFCTPVLATHFIPFRL